MGLQDQPEVSLQPWLFFLVLDSELGISDQIHPKGARLAELGVSHLTMLPTGAHFGQEKSSVSPHPFIYWNLGHPSNILNVTHFVSYGKFVLKL